MVVSRLFSLVVIVLSVLGMPLFAYQQTPRPSAYMQRTFRDVDQAARAASSKDADAVSIKALAEAVLQATWFATLPSRFMNICFGPPLISIQIVKAIDRLASELAVPGWFPTTEEQVRVFRMRILPLAPTILSSPNTPADQVVTQEMTPAGAAYLGLVLFQQKVVNATYQSPADEWVKRMQEPLNPADAPSPGFQLTPDKWKLSDERMTFSDHLQGDIRVASPDVTNALHHFFEALGFERK